MKSLRHHHVPSQCTTVAWLFFEHWLAMNSMRMGYNSAILHRPYKYQNKGSSGSDCSVLQAPLPPPTLCLNRKIGRRSPPPPFPSDPLNPPPPLQHIIPPPPPIRREVDPFPPFLAPEVSREGAPNRVGGWVGGWVRGLTKGCALHRFHWNVPHGTWHGLICEFRVSGPGP